MNAIIEVYAYIDAERTHPVIDRDPKDFSDFVVPEWDVDITSNDGVSFAFRLERLFRVPSGPNTMGGAADVARKEGIACPEGWKFLTIEFAPHMSFGLEEDPELETP